MTTELPPPILIQDARGMGRLLDDLGSQREIAIDTEANSFFNFKERVCLIQITVEYRDYLIDPLATIDIAPLGRVLDDEKKLKVFHDGEYDILMLKRGFGFGFRTLFDTRVAAAALGDPNPGLGSVLKSRFGIDLDKSLQRSNWGQRPLSDEQIRYARFDTHFLIPLMKAQQVELADRGRAMIVEGECQRLEQLVPPEASFNPDEFARLKGARQLSPQEQQNLRELFVLRHRLAEESDLPPFKVLNNQVLFDIVKTNPRSLRELTSVPGFSPRQARRLGDDVLAALARARELGPLRRSPSLPAKDGTGGLSDEELELHERLKLWRTDRAKREGYDASLVLNRHVLLRLAEKKPHSEAELASIDGLLDWQRRAFGPEVIDVVRSTVAEIREHGLSRGARRSSRRGRDE